MQSIVQESGERSDNADGLLWGSWDTDVQKTLVNRGYDTCVCFMCFLWGFVLEDRWKTCSFPAERLFCAAVTEYLHDFRHALYCPNSAHKTLKYEICFIFIRLVTGSWFEECIDIQMCIYKLTCHDIIYNYVIFII